MLDARRLAHGQAAGLAAWRLQPPLRVVALVELPAAAALVAAYRALKTLRLQGASPAVLALVARAPGKAAVLQAALAALARTCAQHLDWRHGRSDIIMSAILGRMQGRTRRCLRARWRSRVC